MVVEACAIISQRRTAPATGTTQLPTNYSSLPHTNHLRPYHCPVFFTFSRYRTCTGGNTLSSARQMAAAVVQRPVCRQTVQMTGDKIVDRPDTPHSTTKTMLSASQLLLHYPRSSDYVCFITRSRGFFHFTNHPHRRLVMFIQSFSIVLFSYGTFTKTYSFRKTFPYLKKFFLGSF